jgi:hypothetical protein
MIGSENMKSTKAIAMRSTAIGKRLFPDVIGFITVSFLLAKIAILHEKAKSSTMKPCRIMIFAYRQVGTGTQLLPV